MSKEESIKILEELEKFYHLGDAGRFLHPRKEEFYIDKKEHENMLLWFIRKAKEALLESEPESAEITMSHCELHKTAKDVTACPVCLVAWGDQINNLQAELKAKNESLQRIQVWVKAYPLKVFPKPTKDNLKQAAEVLKANGLSLDRISADNMRHVLEGVKSIVEQALKGK